MNVSRNCCEEPPQVCTYISNNMVNLVYRMQSGFESLDSFYQVTNLYRQVQLSYVSKSAIQGRYVDNFLVLCIQF